MIRSQSTVVDETSPRRSWKWIVDQVAAGSPMALESLYHSLDHLRFEIAGTLGWEHIDDIYHDTIVALVSAIRNGRVRAPDALPGFARTIVKRSMWRMMREAVGARATVDANSVALRDLSLNPEQQQMQTQTAEIASRVLMSLLPRQREVLTRFYLKQESAAEIKRSMQLTATQFRIMKSRAKACLTERVQAHTVRRGRASDDRTPPFLKAADLVHRSSVRVREVSTRLSRRPIYAA